MEQVSHFILNHWQLCLAFVVLLILTLIYELVDRKKKAKEITPQTAITMINNNHAVIIDLRDKESYKKGHIIDSISLSETEVNEQKLSKYKTKPLIFICARGLTSAKVANQLRAQGYESNVLAGGIASWQRADLPLVKKG